MFLWKTDGERSDTWMQYAQQRGCELVDRAPSLHMVATSHGLTVRLSEWVEHVRPHGVNHNDQYVRRASVSVQSPIETGNLLVTREGVGSKILKAFGGQDIELGDPAFDPVFRVRSVQPEDVPRVLTPAARAALVHVAQSVPDVEISDNHVRWRGSELQDPALMDLLIPAIAYAASWLGK